MDSYVEKCPPPIPIGKQRYAYQCENVGFYPVSGKIDITGFPPSGRGKEPYPNPEADKIMNYELMIGRFTGNAIEIVFKKCYKDGSDDTYLTNVSFAQLVNLLFTGQGANIWKHEPKNNFSNES